MCEQGKFPLHLRPSLGQMVKQFHAGAVKPEPRFCVSGFGFFQRVRCPIRWTKVTDALGSRLVKTSLYRACVVWCMASSYSNAPVFACLHVKENQRWKKENSTLAGDLFHIMPAILVPSNAVYVLTEGWNGNIWIRREEGLNKCWCFSCREKFVNYIGDLRKHKKQLADVNSQQMEELQVLSKTKIKTITTFFYRLRRQYDHLYEKK